MRSTLRIFCLLLSVVLLACCKCDKPAEITSRETLAEAFVTPPDSVRIAAYWYWISNNISNEGVVKDLHAMKKAGITRAFIGNIGQDGVPYGNVPMLSDAWWEVLHTALKTATELDIEIGIFNSPGWSQSGGPWVKPEEAMRYLAASELRVSGPLQLDRQLEIPTELFQDVKVVAYPAPKDDLKRLEPDSAIIVSPNIARAEVLMDGDTTTRTSLPDDHRVELLIHSKGEPFTARTLNIYPTEARINAKCQFQMMGEDGAYRTLATFDIYRPNVLLQVGFDMDAPVTVTFPAATSRNFRLLIDNKQEGAQLAEIELLTSQRVEFYSEKTLAKMFPEPLPYWKEYQWPQQPEPDDPALLIDPMYVLDLTKYMAADGTLSWEVPSGDWVILRTGMTPTGTQNSPASPEATGYEVDKLSRKHAEAHFRGHMGEILRRIPAEDRRSFKVVVQDSYETGGQNITDGFLDEFKTRYGYDPVPYLPAYYGYMVESAEASDRFLWDMRRLVADKVAYDYVAGLRDISHKNGLTTWLENYGHWGFPGEFLMYGGQSDEVGGEFWAEGDLGNLENRAAISAAHIYGKPRVWSESFTSSGREFQRHPAMFKHRGDRFFAEGINATLLHVCISQPYDSLPGINAWFGIEFNRGNTWFGQLDLFTDYLKRTNFMLQQGRNVADVAYFIGEDAPKMGGITDPPLPDGYQYDFINAEVLEKYATVKEGRLTLPHGTDYRLLVLPPLETMRPELLAKIKQLVSDGAAVLGPPPVRSPSLQNQPAADSLVRTLAAELWGMADGYETKVNRYGKGAIMHGMTMEEALFLLDCIPDCELPSGGPFMYGHRTLDGQEIYYITNQSDREQVVTPIFRTAGLQPELWLPTTGAMRDLPAFTAGEQTTAVPLRMAPHESYFVVFSRPATPPAGDNVELNFPQPVRLADAAGPWQVQFDPAMRGPEQPVTMVRLQPWNTAADDAVKYYSGTAVYTTAVTLPAWAEGERVLLDLGRVDNMARVKLNGVSVGGIWTEPYVLDVTTAAQPGANTIEVEVVNTWVNRLIGDSRLPAAQRKTWTVYNPYTPASPLQSSGLIGPVTLGTVPGTTALAE